MKVTIVWALLLGAGAVMALACGDGDGGDGSGNADLTPPPTLSGTPRGLTGPLELGDAIQDVLDAFQQRDALRLRERLSDTLRQQTQDAQLQQLASCLPQGATIELRPDVAADVEGATARITVPLTVTRDGDTSEAELVWEFEQRADGTWGLSALPACPAP